MQTINSSTIAAVTATFKTQVRSGYRAVTPIADKIADVRDSDTLETIYAIIAESPRMREWVGERVAKNFGMQEAKLTAKDYEATLGRFARLRLHPLRQNESVAQGLFDQPELVQLRFESGHAVRELIAVGEELLHVLGDQIEERIDLLGLIPAKALCELLLANIERGQSHRHKALPSFGLK